MMSTEIVVALIAAVVALLSAFVSARAARGAVRLQAEFEQHRLELTKRQAVEDIMARYREPLISAAFALQSRLYNIVAKDFLGKYLRDGDDSERHYAQNSTMFVFGEYLGWVEILRQGVQFLDLGDERRNRLLAQRLDAVSGVLLSDDPPFDASFRLFRAEQRALGELMMVRAPGDERTAISCLGYAAFCTRLDEDPRFRGWFVPLADSIERLAERLPAGSERPVALQHALVDLIQYLDDPPVRFSRQQLTKLAVAGSPIPETSRADRAGP